jgi:hypothetical protein
VAFLVTLFLDDRQQPSRHLPIEVFETQVAVPRAAVVFRPMVIVSFTRTGTPALTTFALTPPA